MQNLETVLVLFEDVLESRVLWPKMVECQEYRSVLQKSRCAVHMCGTWCDAAWYMRPAECRAKEDRPDEGAWPTGLGGFLDQCLLSP